MNIDDISINADNISIFSVKDVFGSLEYAKKSFIKTILKNHSITIPSKATSDTMRSLVIHHLTSGNCLRNSADACRDIVGSLVSSDNCLLMNRTDFQILLLSSLIKSFSLRTFRRIFNVQNIFYESDFSLSKFRRELRKFITRLRKGKSQEEKHTATRSKANKAAQERCELHESWPQIVSKTLKDKIAQIFSEETSSAALSTFTCAACSSETYNSKKNQLLLSQFDLELLKKPRNTSIDNLPYPYPHADSPLKDTFVDPRGISSDDHGNLLALLCKTCHNALSRDKLPPLSLANGTYLGPVPSVLQDLTPIEEAMIARCRSKCWIIQLKEENPLVSTPDTQRGIRGHIIIYPQQTSEITRLLPPSVEDIITPVCVLFVGSSPPTTEWLRQYAKPLCVRREKVRNALLWLKENNHLYSDISINHDVLNSLQNEQVLPFHIEHIIPSDATETLTDRYDCGIESEDLNTQSNSAINAISFQSVVIADVDGRSPVHELRAAALRHVKQGGGYIQIPHDPKPVNEFFNPDLIPMTYPTLFPYGIGGFEDQFRRVAISMKRHVKHLCGLTDRRFQEHYSFLFTAFNILQRGSILLHTSLNFILWLSSKETPSRHVNKLVPYSILDRSY